MKLGGEGPPKLAEFSSGVSGRGTWFGSHESPALHFPGCCMLRGSLNFIKNGALILPYDLSSCRLLWVSLGLHSCGLKCGILVV